MSDTRKDLQEAVAAYRMSIRQWLLDQQTELAARAASIRQMLETAANNRTTAEQVRRATTQAEIESRRAAVAEARRLLLEQLREAEFARRSASIEASNMRRAALGILREGVRVQLEVDMEVLRTNRYPLQPSISPVEADAAPKTTAKRRKSRSAATVASQPAPNEDLPPAEQPTPTEQPTPDSDGAAQ